MQDEPRNSSRSTPCVQRGVHHVDLDAQVVAEEVDRVGGVARMPPTFAAASTTYLGLIAAR